LHGAPADYTQTQPFVDEIVRQGPEQWLDEDRNARFLNTPLEKQGRSYRYQFSRQRAPVLADLAKCYLGGVESGYTQRDAALECAAPNQFKGIGRKGAMLMREYLGDPNAVAVDRHVYNYLIQKHGFIPSEQPRHTSHGVNISDKVQREASWYLTKIAHECGREPVDVQVAAWLWGACHARTRAKRRHRGEPLVWMGDELIIDCTTQPKEDSDKELWL